MQLFLKSKATAWREQKHTGHRANTRAVVQDARLTLDRVKDEVTTHSPSILRKLMGPLS
jgi:hypothetical protein